MRIACNNVDLKVKAPPSKSVYHRELIINFILGARGDYLDDNEEDNDDIKATKSCLKTLLDTESETLIFNCNESGSTLRFMIPVALALKSEANSKLIFRTKGRLIDRPITELAECLEPFGVEITKNKDKNEIEVTGKIGPGEYVIDGSVSSQYVSGLLMALAAFYEESEIRVKWNMVSVHYIDLTMKTLEKYGFDVIHVVDTFYVKRTERKSEASDARFEVEGDWSNGAFLLCLGSLIHDGSIKVTGLDKNSAQGDKAILEFLDLANISYVIAGENVFVQDSLRNSVRPCIDMFCYDIPDIVPYMAVTGAFRAEKTVLRGIKRLRIKESDRAAAITQMLTELGGNVTLEEDTITIEYIDRKNIPDKISLTSSGDHRMAMAAVLCAAATGKEIELDDIDCLNKSFPEFRTILLKEMTV